LFALSSSPNTKTHAPREFRSQTTCHANYYPSLPREPEARCSPKTRACWTDGAGSHVDVCWNLTRVHTACWETAPPAARRVSVRSRGSLSLSFRIIIDQS
ncbi:unnamed protein product, partial [Ectocarpus sp. 8 AP-2014]